MIRNYLNDDSDGQDDSLYQGLEAEAIDFEDDMAMLRAFSLMGTIVELRIDLYGRNRYIEGWQSVDMLITGVYHHKN